MVIEHTLQRRTMLNSLNERAVADNGIMDLQGSVCVCMCVPLTFRPALKNKGCGYDANCLNLTRSYTPA